MTTAPGLGTRPDDVRRHNRAALLRRLHVHGPSTRAELATELGCSANLMGDSAQMNMWLHKAVMQKLAANGGNVPKELLD